VHILGGRINHCADLQSVILIIPSANKEKDKSKKYRTHFIPFSLPLALLIDRIVFIGSAIAKNKKIKITNNPVGAKHSRDNL